MFFYPLDFTFVCPTEIIAFEPQLKEFKKRNVRGHRRVSIDSHFSHLAWKNTKVENGGIGHVQFPLVADLTKTISRDYGVLLEGGMALRGTFLIDKAGMVQHMVVNNLGLGRNIDEMRCAWSTPCSTSRSTARSAPRLDQGRRGHEAPTAARAWRRTWRSTATRPCTPRTTAMPGPGAPLPAPRLVRGGRC
jgi:peroxiredoxin